MNHQSQNTVSTIFVIGGHAFDPSWFTDLTGVAPTRIWYKKPYLAEKRDIPACEWRFQIDKVHESLDDAVQEILAPFSSWGEQIAGFLDSYECTANVVFRIRGDLTNFEMHLEPATIQMLSRLRCGLSLSVNP